MRITLRRAGRPVTYFISEQELCEPRDVEEDILEQCDAHGQLHDVCVDFGGEDIPLVSRHEARIVARMFAAEHNAYVLKNYGYASPRESARLAESPTAVTVPLEPALDADFEQNQELGDPSFGPSHSQYTNW
jgi:hypothetical protein